MNSQGNRLALVLSAILATVLPAQADILLNLDTTNPAAVTINSTTGLSAFTDGGGNFMVRLMGAAGNPGSSSSSSSIGGTLNTLNGGYAYNLALVVSGSSDLDLQHGAGGSTESFTAGQRAFTGSGTVSLSAFVLPGSDLIGDIHLLNNFRQDTGEVLGQYTMHVNAVPEPTTLAFGIPALAFFIRKRRAARG